MALDATKWEVNADKTIRYVGGAHGSATANYVTVLELHRWLQDLADAEGVTGDDYMSIVYANPTDKKFDTIIQLQNGYTLYESGGTPAPEFIYGGTIIQGSGGTEAIWDGISIIAARGCVVNVIQNNTVIANDFWNNTPNGETYNGINFDAANGLAMQFMVKVKNAGSFIDNGSLIFTTREWGKTFSEFRIPATGRGKNSVPLTFADDLNNTTGSGTVAGFTTIANLTAGYNTIDLQQGDGAKGYYSKWDRNTGTSYSINQFYERMKYLTRAGETTTLYGIPGEKFRGITHEVALTTPRSGTFSAFEAVSWSGGTGQMLAIDSTTAGTKMWIQLLTGVAPTAGQLITGGGSSATATSGAGTPSTERTVSTPFCGASTGSSIVGAYGFALEYNDLSKNDKLKALDDVTRSPPNNVTFTVNGVQSGWRVLVGPEDGSGGLNTSQLTASAQLTSAGTTSIVFTETAPANTPSTGTLRVHLANGSYLRIPYSAYNSGTKTFTITSTDFSASNGHTDKKFFISYIDDVASTTSISFSTIQSADQTLYVAARYAGTGPSYSTSIKPANTTGTLGSTGGSATISSVSDA